MSAVFGGVYMLGRRPIGILVDDGDQSCAGVLLDGGEAVMAKAVVVSPTYLRGGTRTGHVLYTAQRPRV
jgi:hypothetical protein